jgi:hypothetical protein
MTCHLLLVVLLAWQPGPQSEGEGSGKAATEAAQRHFRLGVSLYEERDFEGARSEFLRAHRLAPTYRILFNLGQVSQEVHDWAGALQHYEAYLEAGGAQIPDSRRRAVERDVQALQDRVARVSVEIVGGPAELALDDRRIALPPDSVLVLNPGRRRLSVIYPGGATLQRVIEVASGDRLNERFAPAMAPPGSPPAAAVTLVGDREPPRRVSSAAWWSWAATGMVGAAALTTGLLAQRHSRSLAAARAEYPADPNYLLDQQRVVRQYALGTDALLVGGGLLGLTSLYLTFAPRWRF